MKTLSTIITMTTSLTTMAAAILLNHNDNNKTTRQNVNDNDKYIRCTFCSFRIWRPARLGLGN